MIVLVKSSFLYFSLLIIISCQHIKDRKIKEIAVGSYYNQFDSSTILKIDWDSNSNYQISLIGVSNHLNAINGCGNCYIDTNVMVTQKKHLSNRSNYEYIIEAGINGSTYGAKHLFILWKDSAWGIWNITKEPFDRFKVEDISSDGLDEIIEYTPAGDSVVYHFEDGQLHKVK